MYVVCDNMRPLSEAYVFPGSYVECVLRAAKLSPKTKSFNVYLCTSLVPDPKHYLYMSTVNERSLNRLKEKYLNYSSLSRSDADQLGGRQNTDAVRGALAPSETPACTGVEPQVTARAASSDYPINLG